MNLSLGNQVVFVAGSTRGIGRAIASALLQEGARVIITGRDAEALRVAEQELAEGSAADRVLALRGDFTEAKTIQVAMEQSVERFGQLDHLVANLGSGAGKAGWDQPEEEWNRLFQLNFFGSVRLAQAALPFLLQAVGEQGSDTVSRSLLFISSIVAVEATPAPLPYSAAKAALNNYAKNLARQLGPQRIRVNTLCPGNIFFAGGSWERHLANRPEAVEAMLQSEVPQQRFGTPEEIASLAAYLCSSRAGFATGGCFVVDGGQTRRV